MNVIHLEAQGSLSRQPPIQRDVCVEIGTSRASAMPAEVDALRGEMQILSRQLEARLAQAEAETKLQIATTRTEILKLMVWAAIVGQAGLILAVGAVLWKL